jgi:hypothetical protein
MNSFLLHEKDYLLMMEIQQQVCLLIDDQLHNVQDLYKQLKLSYVHVWRHHVIAHIYDVEQHKLLVCDLQLKKKKRFYYVKCNNLLRHISRFLLYLITHIDVSSVDNEIINLIIYPTCKK